MLAELHASVQPLRHRGRTSKTTPVFTTVRQLRSAASQYLGWNLITSQPSGSMYFQDRCLLQGNVRPTDSAPYELFSRGMQARMGDESTPSTALLGRHIRGLNTYFDARYLAAADVSTQNDYALAGFANYLLWFSWLRGGETFALTWGDLVIIWPHEAAAYDLPTHTGALLLQLLPETKSSRAPADDHGFRYIPVAPSGSAHAPNNPQWGGRTWNSQYYRQNFVYPGLEYLRGRG